MIEQVSHDQAAAHMDLLSKEIRQLVAIPFCGDGSDIGEHQLLALRGSYEDL